MVTHWAFPSRSAAAATRATVPRRIGQQPVVVRVDGHRPALVPGTLLQVQVPAPTTLEASFVEPVTVARP